MAEIAEIQLMKVTSFSDGTDTIKGIREFGYRKNAQPTYGVRLEGELLPSRLEAIESDQSPFSGVATFSGPQAASLAGTVVPSATINARDVTDTDDVSAIAVTNMHIKGYNTQLNNRQTGVYAYDFDATNVVVGTPA